MGYEKSILKWMESIQGHKNRFVTFKETKLFLCDFMTMKMLMKIYLYMLC